MKFPTIRLVTILGFAAAVGVSEAATITVNTFEDGRDADLSDGVVDADLVTPGEQRTLRAAIQHANFTPGADEIILPAGEYNITIDGPDESKAGTGDMDITDDLTISGAGAEVSIIDADKTDDRIFDIAGTPTVTIRDVTMKNGHAFTNGGCIRTDGATLVVEDCVIAKCRADNDAGAVSHNSGDSTFRRMHFLKNRAEDDAGALEIEIGTVSIEDSTFSLNRASSEGGAIECDLAVLTIVNTTFSKNKAAKEGGALSLECGATVSLLNCTFAFNKAKLGSAISARDDVGGTITTTVQNTIFADLKPKKEFVGTASSVLTSLGGNIDRGKSCGFGAGDLSKTNARLVKKLADNGGSTPTHALKSNSSAIDMGNDTDCPTADQRGLPRVDIPGVGAAVCDSGAFEVQ